MVTKVEPLNSKQSDLLQAADVLMGGIGFHCQDLHLKPNANKEKVELARYFAARLGICDLKHERNPIKETFKNGSGETLDAFTALYAPDLQASLARRYDEGTKAESVNGYETIKPLAK